MCTRFSVVVLFVLVGVLAGCGSAELSLQDQMVGIWTTNLKGIYVTFDADGTFGKGFSPDTEFEWGTWTVDDGVLTLNTSEDEGIRYCSGDTGTYEIELTENEVLVTLMDDPCAKRKADFPSGLTRHTDTTP